MADNDIIIQFGGEAITLPCTLDAAKAISAFYGDLVCAFKRVAAFDVSACFAVVALALGKTRAEVEAPVFETGFDAIVPELLRYLVRLANGGREPSALTVAKTEKAA